MRKKRREDEGTNLAGRKKLKEGSFGNKERGGNTESFRELDLKETKKLRGS